MLLDNKIVCVTLIVIAVLYVFLGLVYFTVTFFPFAPEYMDNKSKLSFSIDWEEVDNILSI